MTEVKAVQFLQEKFNSRLISDFQIWDAKLKGRVFYFKNGTSALIVDSTTTPDESLFPPNEVQIWLYDDLFFLPNSCEQYSKVLWIIYGCVVDSENKKMEVS